MEIAQLRYFLAASESESFTAAAKKCFTSRQNLTRSIRNLEDELATTLFTRSGNRSKLTLEGEQAAEHARVIVDEAHILEDLFKTEHPMEQLKVLLSTNSNLFLPRKVYKEAFSFDFAVSEYAAGTCYQKIVEMERDVALVSTMERSFPGCSDVLIRRDHMFYLVRQDSELAARGTLRIEDLAGHDICIMPDREFVYGPFLERYRELGLNERQLHQIGSIALVKNEIRSNDAVGFATAKFKRHPIPGIVAIPAEEDFMNGCIYALYQRGSKHVSSVLKLVTRIRQICTEAYGQSA